MVSACRLSAALAFPLVSSTFLLSWRRLIIISPSSSNVCSGRNDELDMRGMNEDDLMTLCALSGCDYLPSVHGMGLKKAYRMVSRHKEASAIDHSNPDIIYIPCRVPTPLHPSL